MARPQKIGLDYFPLDVDIDQDDKVAIIEAQHGILGFSVVIKLLMKIYSEGYYYDWTEKEQILFSKRVNVDINEVNVIINDCIKWGMFSEELFNEHKILTSKGIQTRYLEAVKRRSKVEMAKEFLLLSDEIVNANKNISIVTINDDINQEVEGVNVDINPQSKLKKSKVKYIKENNIKVNDIKVNNNKEEQEKENDVVVVVDKSKNILDGQDSEIDSSIDSNLNDLDFQDNSLSDQDLQRVAIAFEQSGFGTIDITVKNLLVDLAKDFSVEWILEAMKVAVESNKRSLRYVKGILQNWNREGGIKTKSNKTKQKYSSPKKTRFHNFDQRSDKYSNDQLEDVIARKRREHTERMKNKDEYLQEG